MKKSQIITFLKRQAQCGNSVWTFVNGGGASLTTPDIIENFIKDFDNEKYSDKPIRLEKGDEPEDFRCLMSKDEYEGTKCFFCFKHYTAYNQENVDIIIQYWED